MREIDEVRITLLRLFRGAVRLPDEIIDEMLKAFLHTRNAAIKVQAYGRGTLARFRDMNLIFGIPFNTQVRVLHDNFMMSGRTNRNDTRDFQGEWYMLYENDLCEWSGLEAIWATRAHRRSKKALGLHLGPFGRKTRDEPLALFRRWLRYTEKRMAWYHAHHRLRWTRESSPAYWRAMRALGLSVAQIRNLLGGTLRLSDIFKGPPKGTSLAWQEDWS